MASAQDLEQRLDALMNTIERERAERRQEAATAAARIADLEAKLAAASVGTPNGRASNGHRAASPPSPLTRTPGSASATLKRAASANKVGASEERAPSVDGRVSVSNPASTTPARPGSAPGSKFSTNAGRKAAEAASEAPVTTAAQHSWDKLCALVRNDLTVKELWLVSLDTLRQLLMHYGVTDPIECAQIECQWALLQEGKHTVERPTLKRAASPRAKPFEPANHKGQEFNLRPDAAKPHLSRRNLLQPDVETRKSNPNHATAHARSVSPGGKGFMHADPMTGSNPNESVSPMRSFKGRKTFDCSPSNTMDREDKIRRGKARDHSPAPEKMQPYPNRADHSTEGVKRFSQGTPTAEHRHRGLKTGYAPPEAKDTVRSVRTVASGGGAVQWSLG